MESLPSNIGPYRVIRQLGEGGMGTVFEALHEVIQRRVAVKVLHADAGRNRETINRFINEARAANLVSHPGLVQITDFGNLPDGAGYLVMEYLEGETLTDRLQSRGGKLSASETVQIGIQIAAAVASAHKKEIIHRDLKPSNIMLVPEASLPTGERVKVLDFGLAKLSEGRQAALVQTQSHAVLGTPMYMSPEQCEGAGQVDAKSDVYALGCILYELLSGQPPFLGEGAGQIIGKHMFVQPQPLAKLVPSVSPGLSTIVHRLLVKPKEERPSMREVQRALEGLVAELPAPPRLEDGERSGETDAVPAASRMDGPTLNATPTEQHSRGRKTALVLGAALVVAAAIVAAVLLWPARPAGPVAPRIVVARPAVAPVSPPPPPPVTAPESPTEARAEPVPPAHRPKAEPRAAALAKPTHKPSTSPTPHTSYAKPLID